MINNDIAPGIYHGVTPAGCSWYDFANLVFETAGVKVKITPVSSDEFPTSFRRPSDSRLENAALNSAGIMIMPELGESVVSYLGDGNE